MRTLHQALSTTEMEVTSIRLERDLKEKLKVISGNQGYQALIREVLWNFVETQNTTAKTEVDRNAIRATIPATACKEQECMITGKLLRSGSEILLGLTKNGVLVPLSIDSLMDR